MSLYESHPAGWTDDRLLSNCSVQRVRRSGPGGQHRNKVETGIVLTFTPTGCVAQASEERSQSENLAHAIKRLRFKLAQEYRMQPEHGKLPILSELWKQRSRNGKLAINTQHADFVILLAELFDLLEYYKWELKPVAELGGVSQSQLHKFIKQMPSAEQLFQHQRIAHGLHPLK